MPPIITPLQAPTESHSKMGQTPQSAARERAIAKLLGQGAPQGNAQEHPVANANSISPEELGAVKGQQSQEDETEVLPVPEANPVKLDGQDAKGETPVSEEPAAEAPKAEPEKPLSSEYAILARKEKALRLKAQQQDAAFKAREQALATREAALTQKDSQYSDDKYISKDRLLQDTWNVLAEAGISYEQVTQQALTAQSMDPMVRQTIKALEDKIAKLEGTQEDFKKNSQEQQGKAYNDALNQIRFEAKQLVSRDPNYESIKETGAVDEVVTLIETTFKEDGVLMTVEEACEEVEKEIAERIWNYSNKISKVKKRFEPSAQTAPTKQPGKPAAQAAQQPAKQQQMKTLTNSVGTSRQLSSRERAILAFKGELKS